MFCTSQNGTTKRKGHALAVVLSAASLLLTSQFCRADLPSSGATTTDWKPGPDKSALQSPGETNSLGELNIPPDFKFMGASAAGALLQRNDKQVPKNLLGLLAPASENWWIVLQFADIGYVQHPETETLAPDEILKGLGAEVKAQNADRGKQGLHAFSGVKWELQPAYDATNHSLGWAVLKQSTNSVVSQTLRLFCRRGAVDATVVRPSRGYTELAPLGRLAKNIVFKDGERYADFKQGDKTCAKGLAELVSCPDIVGKDVSTAEFDSGSGKMGQDTKRFVLIGVGVLAFVVVIGGALFLNRAGRRRAGTIRRVKQAAAPATPAEPALPAAKPAMASLKLGVPAPPHRVSAKPTFPKLRPSHSGPNGKSLNGKRNGQQRRKVFDYNRYFTDLMGAVSSHSTQMDMAPANGVSVEPSRMPSEVKPVDAAEPASTATPNSHAQLLASQRDLIEEQKRLIQEQNKLIEEKTRLIAEKNALLKMQSQFMEDKLR